jgi:DNA-binding FadR family transcriptional regulator
MSRTDDVVNGIKHMILAGKLRPGERLPVERELAEALGVSRGPLREGIRALSILGIVNTRQGDGTYVTSLDVSRLVAPMGFVVDLQGACRDLAGSEVRDSESARIRMASHLLGVEESLRDLPVDDDELLAEPEPELEALD